MKALKSEDITSEGCHTEAIIGSVPKLGTWNTGHNQWIITLGITLGVIFPFAANAAQIPASYNGTHFATSTPTSPEIFCITDRPYDGGWGCYNPPTYTNPTALTADFSTFTFDIGAISSKSVLNGHDGQSFRVSSLTGINTSNPTYYFDVDYIGGTLYINNQSLGNLTPNSTVISNIVPRQGSTTSTTFNTSFDWVSNASPSPADYSICFQQAKNLFFVSSTTQGCLTGSLTSSSGSVTRSATLPTGIYAVVINITQGNIIGSINWTSNAQTFAVSTSSSYDSLINQAFPNLTSTGTSTIVQEIGTALFSFLGNKQPFSWFVDIAHTYENLSSSASTTLPKYSLQYHDLGIGSTSPVGDILPNFDFLSTTTVRRYIPDWLYNFAMGLQAAVFFVLMSEYLWQRMRGFFKKT